MDQIVSKITNSNNLLNKSLDLSPLSVSICEIQLLEHPCLIQMLRLQGFHQYFI
jgi:hypothetical protein